MASTSGRFDGGRWFRLRSTSGRMHSRSLSVAETTGAEASEMSLKHFLGLTRYYCLVPPNWPVSTTVLPPAASDHVQVPEIEFPDITPA